MKSFRVEQIRFLKCYCYGHNLDKNEKAIVRNQSSTKCGGGDNKTNSEGSKCVESDTTY